MEPVKFCLKRKPLIIWEAVVKQRTILDIATFGGKSLIRILGEEEKNEKKKKLEDCRLKLQPHCHFASFKVCCRGARKRAVWFGENAKNLDLGKIIRATANVLQSAFSLQVIFGLFKASSSRWENWKVEHILWGLAKRSKKEFCLHCLSLILTFNCLLLLTGSLQSAC